MNAENCPECGSQINEFGIIRVYDNMVHRLCECGFETALDHKKREESPLFSETK